MSTGICFAGRKRGRPRKIRTPEDEKGKESGDAKSKTPSPSPQSVLDSPTSTCMVDLSTDIDNVESKTRGLSEQENSAAEGLLGLSDADGVRRSTRVKKKSKTLHGRINFHLNLKLGKTSELFVIYDSQTIAIILILF